MTHRWGAVWTERVFLILILASLAGTLNLVVTMHRRVATSDLPGHSPNPTLPSVISAPTPAAETALSSATPTKEIKPAPVSARPLGSPTTPVQDPTIKALAGMSRAIAVELGATQDADRHTGELETARKAAVAESERWKRRELLVRQQIARLSQRAVRLEQETSELDAERDVLARERDALKAALTKAGQQSGNSILPYKGPNGTWRRPIVVECVGNVAKLQPQGQTFSMMELSPLIHPRSSPIVLAIAREMLRIDRAGTPDGAPVVPYLVFMVRPNGIRPYYEVRARLEPLGIAFGYELVEQDLVVDIPDYDDLTTWDGTKPLDLPGLASANPKPRTDWPSTSGTDSQGRTRARGLAALPPEDSGTSGAWPASRDGGGMAGSGSNTIGRNFAQGGRSGIVSDGTGPEPGQLAGGRPTAEIALGGYPGRGNRPDGSGGAGSDDGSPDDFVWPSNSRNGGSRGPSGSNPARMGSVNDASLGDGSGSSPTGSGSLSSPAFGAGVQGPAGGSPFGGSLPSTPPAGNGTGTGLSGGGFGRPGGSSTGSMTGGQGGLGSSTGSLTVSGGRPGSSPNHGGLSGGGAGSGSESDSRPGAGHARNRFGPGGPDALPDLEPAQDGTEPSAPATGGPISGSTPSRSAAEGDSGLGANSGGPGSKAAGGGPSGSVANGGGGGMTAPVGSPAIGADPMAGGQSQGNGSEHQGGGQPPPSGTGSPASDPGFAAYPSGVAASGAGGKGQGSVGTNSPAGSGSFSGTSNPPTNGGANSASSNDQDAASPSNAASRTTVAAAGSGSFNSSALSPFSPSSSASASSSSSSSASPLNSLSPMMGSQSASSSLESMMPSTFSSGDSSSPSSSTGGQQGGSGTPTSSAGMGLPSLNLNPDPNSEPDALKEFAVPSIALPDRPAKSIEVPFEIIVVCRRNDLLLHPGGWRITKQALRDGGGKPGAVQDSLLKQELRAVVRRRAEIDPLIRPKPSIKFLVEADGSTTFWIAQRQLVFSGLDWPMSLQVAGPQSRHVFNKETWDAVDR